MSKKGVEHMAFRLAPWRRGGTELARPQRHDPFESLRREMNRVFEDFNRSFGLAPTEGEGLSSQWAPRVNMWEDDKGLHVSAELPGMEEKDIDVSLSNDTLLIKGEKREEKEDKGKNFFRTERVYGSFERAIPLPFEVQQDKVDASFKKGVLEITLPKSPTAQKQVQKIEVKS